MRVYPVLNYALYNNCRKKSEPSFTATPRVPMENLNELRVFIHHIYEYKKGLRSLILTTEKKTNQEYIEKRLEKEGIPYIITPVGERAKTINVFFGNEDCINVVKTFQKPLNKLSDEQDFMLGIMLGYDKILQCQRYIKRLGNKLNPITG